MSVRIVHGDTAGYPGRWTAVIVGEHMFEIRSDAESLSQTKALYYGRDAGIADNGIGSERLPELNCLTGSFPEIMTALREIIAEIRTARFIGAEP